jgi:hypothetical protein
MNNAYRLLFASYVVCYFFLYGFYGYNNADDGYVLAFSWRIFNGEIPYKDFILVKPPLSPILHSLTLFLLPDTYQIIFERFLFYLSMALSSLFGSLTLRHVFKFEDLDVDPYLLATIGFVFSVNHFPPMPWQTVDGIFFASLGIYILARYANSYSIGLGILSLFLSALCKQSFYLMPVAGIVYVAVVSRDYKKALTALLAFSACLIVFISVLYKYNIANEFMLYTTGSTKFKDLLAAGVHRYMDFPSFYFLITGAFYLILLRLPENKYVTCHKSLLPYFFISLLLLKHVPKFLTHYYGNTKLDFFEDDVATILFIVVIFLLIAELKLEKKWLSLSFLVLLSWSSGISWGYQTPVLFSVPLLFGLFFIARHYFKVINLSRFVLFTLIVGTITYFIAYQKPAFSADRRELTYELSEVFPKLKSIKVDKEVYDKYVELKKLIAKYGTNFKTLPEMPLANYLSDTQSPIGLDWVFNAETNFRNDELINTLMRKRTTVFVEKHPQCVVYTDSNAKLNSSVTYHIVSTWRKVESTKHFDVFQM